MRNFIQLLLGLLLSTSLLAQDCEDFDDLTVGGYVAEQLGENWTTWSGLPGGDDDAIVSDDQSHSPNNSFVVTEGIDLLYKLAEEPIEEGAWLYSHYIYVPSGFSGYFNVQSSPIPGVEWVIEMYFNDDGTGFFEGGSAETFAYTMDTWILVEVNFDLDSDLAEVFIDGALVTEFDNNFSIGGIDFWASDTGGIPGAYYDDVCFGVGTPILNDDCYYFDELDPGEFLALQLGGMWTTWSGSPGGDDDTFVSDDQSHSPDNSFVIFENIADVILKLDEEPIETGAWLYSHYIYVASGATGYFNVQSSPIPGEEWVIELYFNGDGTGYFEGGSSETFDFNNDTWILVEINFDLDTDLAQVFFDGVLVTEFANEFTIGGINYYGSDTNGDPEAYYDDVCFSEGMPIAPVGCYNFDDLDPGEFLALQLGGMWTTWGNNPGGEGDGFVSDDQSHSPNNSFVIFENINDVIYKLDDEPIETGAWLYSHYMYVAAGATGYFNVQSSPIPGEEWVIELYFDNDGTGYFEGGSSETFDYSTGTWILVEINFDLDVDLAQVFFDGNLVTEFTNEFTIGGINYYGDDGNGPPEAYYDDVCFGEGTPITNENCNNFDELDPGEFLALQLGGMWTTWSGTPGGDDDTFVSNDQSHSPNNSFVIFENIADVVLKLDEEPIETGAWLYSHYIYVAAGATGYFNVQSSPVPGEEWVIELYFNGDGTGYFEGGSSETFDFSNDTWILVEINFDLDTDLAQVFFDGILVTEFTNEFTIGGINYYGSDTNGDPEAYYDDVCFDEGTAISSCYSFDELDPGEFLALQLGGMWTTWSGIPGGADDSFVSDDQSHSPNNSFVIFENIADVILKLDEEPIAAGAWLYSHYIYVTSGATGYFNVQSSPTPGEEWVIELYFNGDGTGYFEGGSSETFDFSNDTWILVEINFDLDSDLVQVLFDGVLVTEFTNEFTIGGINYYGSDTNGDPEAYYDDVCFDEGWTITRVEKQFVNTIHLYPNPATQTINIKSGSTINQVEIYNQLGQLVKKLISNSNNLNINISDFETGVYFVKVSSHDQVITRKLVIE